MHWSAKATLFICAPVLARSTAAPQASESPAIWGSDEPWVSLQRNADNQTSVHQFNQTELRHEVESHWEEFQSLTAKADALHEQITREKSQIRQLLQQDCSHLQAKWDDCGGIGCKFKVTLQQVPDMLRQMRYRFGPFPSSLPDTICLEWGQTGQCEHSQPESTTEEQPQFTQPPPAAVTGNILNGQSEKVANSTSYHAETSNPLPSHHEVKDFLRTTATILLVIAIGNLLFKACCNSTRCRRRGADRAARREERQARRAYRSAARRLRWRQWWQGTPYQPASMTSDHDLEALDSEQAQHSDEGRSRSVERGTMQTEIQRLRRVFDYVGGLVRDGGDDFEGTRAPLRHAQGSPDERSVTASAAPSSTDALTTSVNSPRASSLMTLDTPSSITLDTLDTDTNPPSYTQ